LGEVLVGLTQLFLFLLDSKITYQPTNQTLFVHIFTQISLDHFAKGEQDQTPRSRYLVTLDNLNKK